MINIEWTEGAPKRLKVGMVVRHAEQEGVILIGDYCELTNSDLITHWAWLIKPYQLSWIDSKTGVPKR